MFLYKLNSGEIKYFFNKSNELIKLDGYIHYAEENALEMYKQEIGLDRYNKVMYEEGEIDISNEGRKYILIELLNLAYCDGIFESLEINFINEICYELKVSQEEYSKYRNFTETNIKLTNDLKKIIDHGNLNELEYEKLKLLATEIKENISLL